MPSARNDPATYIREWRKTPSGQASLKAQKRRDQARRAAIKNLIKRHQMEFEALFMACLQEVEKKARVDD